MNVFHSAAIYCDPLSGDDAATQTITFVGDRMPTRGYFPVVLKPEKSWTWPKVAINMNTQAFSEFYGVRGNRLHWWQLSGLKATRQLPTILYIPLALADFLVVAQHTPWELHTEVR